MTHWMDKPERDAGDEHDFTGAEVSRLGDPVEPNGHTLAHRRRQEDAHERVRSLVDELAKRRAAAWQLYRYDDDPKDAA